MSDRKYRQRGYQDGDRREPAGKRPERPAEPVPREMRVPNLPGFREVARCVRCGALLAAPVVPDGRCHRCGTDLHSCVQCASFDAGSRFECTQPVQARVSPKDTRNACALFSARVTIERETTSSRPPDARKAFDDLFK